MTSEQMEWCTTLNGNCIQCKFVDGCEHTTIETNIYDKEEIVENCTVQIWSNSVTGKTSIGWWKNE